LLRIAWTVGLCWWCSLRLGGFYYFKYQGIVDARLKQPLFADTAKFCRAARGSARAKAQRSPDRQ
jgi:hypothetical protein